MRRLPTVAFLLACAVGMSRAHRGCMSYNGWFYDLSSDDTMSTLDRYQGATFVDRNNYAAFHLPAAGTTTWDEGVAFAATMQTRNAWLNNEPTSAGSWFVDSATGNDRFSWSTTVNGAPVQFTFTTEACLGGTNPPPPPPTSTALATHRGCANFNGWFFDLTAGPAGTTLLRYQGASLVDRQSYAAFHLPAAGTTTWDEGVGFAATMQTRNAWLNYEPTAAATWVYDASANADTWTWTTTVNGAPMQLVLATATCASAPVSAPDAPVVQLSHRGCISNNGWFYDIKTDASTTTLDRYQGTTFVDRNTYAALHMPIMGTTTWDEGVGFAATMQTRNVWLNNEPIKAATWVYDAASTVDTWTWSTTVNGAPVQFSFTTAACVGAPTSPTA